MASIDRCQRWCTRRSWRLTLVLLPALSLLAQPKRA
jgi:hypothetical protein